MSFPFCWWSNFYTRWTLYCVISASFDGTVKCHRMFIYFSIPGRHFGDGYHCRQCDLTLKPENLELLCDINRSSTMVVASVQGQTVRSFRSDWRPAGDLVCWTLSPRDEWIYLHRGGPWGLLCENRRWQTGENSDRSQGGCNWNHTSPSAEPGCCLPWRWAPKALETLIALLF